MFIKNLKVNHLSEISEVSGTIENITEFLMKSYCMTRFPEVDISKSSYLGISSLNDIQIIRKHNKYPGKYKFWAGLSGCNWNLLDSTGGNHMVSNFRDEIVYLDLKQLPKVWKIEENKLRLYVKSYSV